MPNEELKRRTNEKCVNLERKLNEVNKQIKSIASSGDFDSLLQLDDLYEKQGALESKLQEIRSRKKSFEVRELRVMINDSLKTFYVVDNTDVLDPSRSMISSSSPIALATVGKTKGESFDFQTPSGVKFGVIV